MVKILSALTIGKKIISQLTMNRPLSLKHTVQPFSVPTEQKTTVLPTQSQRKQWEAVQRLKLESCSVMGVTEEGPFPRGGGPLVPLSPSLQLFVPLISSSESNCLRLKAGWYPLERAWIQTKTSRQHKTYQSPGLQ